MTRHQTQTTRLTPTTPASFLRFLPSPSLPKNHHSTTSTLHYSSRKILAIPIECSPAAELLEEAKACADGVIAFLAELVALDQGLIDKKEVPGFITLGIKGWMEKAVPGRQ